MSGYNLWLVQKTAYQRKQVVSEYKRVTDLFEILLHYPLLDAFSYNLAQIYPRCATRGIIPMRTNMKSARKFQKVSQSLIGKSPMEPDFLMVLTIMLSKTPEFSGHLIPVNTEVY